MISSPYLPERKAWLFNTLPLGLVIRTSFHTVKLASLHPHAQGLHSSVDVVPENIRSPHNHLSVKPRVLSCKACDSRSTLSPRPAAVLVSWTFTLSKITKDLEDLLFTQLHAFITSEINTVPTEHFIHRNKSGTC